jgi:hypothetical protein
MMSCIELADLVFKVHVYKLSRIFFLLCKCKFKIYAQIK